MSSMRNAVQRRNHKERAQPLEREKWGILEKHKDYALRAKDYGRKKQQLKRLREKAADRNPDEFHFAMLRSRTHSGGQRIKDRGNKALSTDAVKLLKTQDAGYLAVAAQQTRNERLKLEQIYNIQSSRNRGQNLRLSTEENTVSSDGRVVFVESKEAQAAYGTLDQAGHFLDSVNLDEEDIVSHSILRSKADQAEIAKRALQKKRNRQRQTRETRLQELGRQETGIAAAQRELSLQRARINTTVGGITKAGVKWKVRERKR